ncbi:MAG: CHAD domain-containing protein [Salinicola sp.]|uniref:CHAD domain-containing protein n=1 Tax=Salinicola sp. TaxID=1978524 RepID=UPI001DD0388B|nr:CHAD domain-containing protein [Salinicola sp.]NRB55665.1 CHAD domain-containing protein [Salinicola sp.]
MPYRLKAREEIESGVRRIATEQVDRARRALAGEHPADAIHELRQRCKKIRALLRLVRPALGKRYALENRRFRDLAREVAGDRDDQVLVTTFDALLAQVDERIDRRHYAAIRRKLDLRRQHACGQETSPDLGALDARLLEAREAIALWCLDRSGFAAIAGGWQRSYEQGRDALARVRVEPTTVALHDWRKRVKYHRHHCSLLREAWPRVLEARAEEGHRLSDMLAEHLNAGEMSSVDASRRAQLATWIERRRAKLRSEALPLGRRLFAEPGKPVRKRMARYWGVATAR